MTLQKGLRLEVTDQEKLVRFLKDNFGNLDYTYDPEVQMENWIEDLIPTSLYIVQYEESTIYHYYYKTVDEFETGDTTWNTWNEPLIERLLEEGILENTDETHPEVVEAILN